MRANKYHAKKQEIDGIKFDSKKEARRYSFLKDQEGSGIISDLQMQVPFQLIPSQYDVVDGKKKCIEREIKYIADFVYYKDGSRVVEDVKGYRNGKGYDIFVIKRKLMRYLFGIEVIEV